MWRLTFAITLCGLRYVGCEVVHINFVEGRGVGTDSILYVVCRSSLYFISHVMSAMVVCTGDNDRSGNEKAVSSTFSHC